jgi:predicted DCC family thiol-disulfide oxidoreductase YuxK
MAHAIGEQDTARRYRLVAIQSEAGRELARRFHINADEPETYAVVLEGKAYFKSDASLVLARTIPGWRSVLMARIAPRFVRDAAYDVIARNRYRWFGKRAACLTPDAGLRSRIIEHTTELGA